MRTQVLPRDIKPGDKVDRLNQDLEIVLATVEKVIKINRQNTTAYRVYLEQGDVPEHQRAWPEHSHLRAFTVGPRQRVWVTR